MNQKKLHQVSGPLFFTLGCILLFILVKKFGYGNLVTTFNNLGSQVIYVLVLPFFWNLSHTIGWFLVLSETGSHISLWQLLKIKLAGESVNTLTPVSFMGGDPIRLYMLQKRMPGTLSAASVVLDRTMQTLAIVVLLLVTLVAAWFYLDLPPLWQTIFPLATLLMAAGIVYLIHYQRKGLFEPLARISAKLGFKKFQTEALRERIDELDERISRFYRHDKKRFLLILASHCAARLLGVLEIYLIGVFLGTPITPLEALFLTSLSILVNIAFVFVPGSMGVMEGAYGVLFHLMGHSVISGVAIQLVRRLRTLFWILVGLVFMVVYMRSHPSNPSLEEASEA